MSTIPITGISQESTYDESKNDKNDSSQSTQVITSVEPSFFDELAKGAPLWISNPWEHPKVKKMSLSKLVLQEGWLYKKSRDENLPFKARYFALYEDRLEVFRDQKEMKIQRASNIMLLEAVRLDLRPICEEDLKQLNERERYFLMFLSCKMRFFLFAKDADTYNKWVKQLKRTCILTNYSQTYENIKVLGKGTFAKVYLSKFLKGGGEYAVKIFDKRALLSNKSAEKSRIGLLHEIQILRKCDHPNIIKLYEVYESDNYIYLVLSVLRGGELFDTIIKTGHFSEKNAGQITKQLLSALEYIHSKNIMHRDIKPENLIFVDKTDSLQIKLADFGLASFTNDDLLFKRCGTPGYVAPEILEDQKYDSKVDIFSSGVIFYILLTGCSPFYGKSYNEILLKNKNCQISYEFNELGVKVSPEATDLLQKMLKQDPNERITASQALNHPFFETESAKVEVQNDSFDSLGSDGESTAFENMRNFQSNRFNVQNIKPPEIKPYNQKDLVSMTPMLGGRNLKNPQGEDIVNSNEKCMSPQKKIKPGDYKPVTSSVNNNDYMHKLMGVKKNVSKEEEKSYELKQTASIPETPMQFRDEKRKIGQIKLEVTEKKEKSIPTNSTQQGNRNSTIKDLLKNLL